MPMMRFLTLLCGLLLSTWAHGQQAIDIGQHWVHYNTFNTALLTPEVARAYGIERSGQRSLLNIAVLRKGEAAGLDQPVAARVSAVATNLAGQRRELDMKEVRDGGAIYYIASFRIRNRERLTFVVEVEPLDEPVGRHSLRFEQVFYVEP